MGKTWDINWNKLDKVCDEVDKELKTLKSLNDKLDETMVKLYKVFQCPSSIKMYSNFAGHMDNTYKWVNAFKKFNAHVEGTNVWY
jgi:hypothetical protein